MSAASMMKVGLSRLTATWSGVILILVVSFSDGVGAERAQAAESESSTIHGNQIKWKEADRQRSLRTGEPELGQLLQLAELKLDPGKLGRIATNAINRWPAAQEADPVWEHRTRVPDIPRASRPWRVWMRRTEQAQGLRLMKFEEVYGRTRSRLLSQAEAGRCWACRNGPSGAGAIALRRGAEGLYDRRLGRVSARRAPVDEVVRVLELFDTRYWDFTAKHFHDGRRARLRAQLQLGAPDLAGTWAHAGCAPARRAPAQASAPCASRHDAASGRLAPRVGPRSMVGPDRDHGRRHQRETRPSLSTRRVRCRVSGRCPR